MVRVSFPLLPWWSRWLGAIAMVGLLLYFSLLTKPPAGPPDPTVGAFWDKKLHLAGYATLGLSLIYATAAGERSPARRALLTIGVAVAFGVLVELVQGPLPNRYFSYADMLANAFGATLAASWFFVESRLEYVRVPP